MALGLGLIGLAALLLLTLRPIGSLRAYVILSASMRPSLQPGALVVTKRLPTEGYREGDMVTFRLPTQGGTIVTHRIVRRYVTTDGIFMVRTKGDANPGEDSWTITSDNIIGRSVLVLPWLGYLLIFLRTRPGFVMGAITFFVVFVWREVRYLVRTVNERGAV